MSRPCLPRCVQVISHQRPGSAATSRPYVFTSLAQIAKAVADFDGSLQHIEVLVSRLQAQPWSQICGPGMAPLDSARMHLMIAYTVNALFWMYLRTQGVDVHDHPVRAELERVKKALRKVKEAEKEAEAKASAAALAHAEQADGGAGAQRQIALNKAAAHRFVMAALSGAPASSPMEVDAASGEESGAAGEASSAERRGEAVDTADRRGRVAMSSVPAEVADDLAAASASASAAASAARKAEKVRVQKQLPKEADALQKQRKRYRVRCSVVAHACCLCVSVCRSCPHAC